MKINHHFNVALLSVLLFTPLSVCANSNKNENNSTVKQNKVYQLSYIEREPGVDDYEVTMLVTNQYIRIDEVNENSGYILYDDKEKTIYSVSHHDHSVLVVNEHVFTQDDSPAPYEIEYLQLADAPAVSGRNIFNYRVFTGKGDAEETCTEIQLVENLLPEVTSLLANYQKVVSGQLVKMTDNKVNSIQNACYYIDQIYNTGAYYSKGLPIQEWHSNDRSRILLSYKAISHDPEKFKLPENYRHFSMDKESRTFIK